jgi:hypothetical protein
MKTFNSWVIAESMSSTYQNKKNVYRCMKTFNFWVIAESMSSTYQNKKKMSIDVWKHLIFELYTATGHKPNCSW